MVADVVASCETFPVLLRLSRCGAWRRTGELTESKFERENVDHEVGTCVSWDGNVMDVSRWELGEPTKASVNCSPGVDAWCVLLGEYWRVSDLCKVAGGSNV